jgi:hypothetical protein
VDGSPSAGVGFVTVSVPHRESLMKKLLASSLILTFALAAPLSAEDKPKPEKPEKPKVSAEERFKKLDKDSSGDLSLEEFKGKRDEAKAKAAFDKRDKDKNGKLSLAEFAPAPKKPKAAK